MTVLTDYQFQLGMTGVVLGGPGSSYKIEAIDGLDRDFRADDQDRPNWDGAVMAPDFAVAKVVTLTLNIVASTPALAMAKYDDLASDWATARGTEGLQRTNTLRWKFPGQVARCLIGGRTRRLGADLTNLKFGLIRAVASYYAPDPRMYSDDEHTADLTYGSPNQTIPNVGNIAAPVIWDLNGSATNPKVIRSETDQLLLTAAISAGVFYRVRTDQRTVTKSSDSSNRYQDFSGTWLEIPAGGALFRAARDSGAAGSHVTATFRDTWL